MYELPSLEGVIKVVIDEAVIKGESKPLLIFENSRQRASGLKKVNVSKTPRISKGKSLKRFFLAVT